MQRIQEILFVGGAGPSGIMELEPSETDVYVSLADALSQNGLSVMSLCFRWQRVRYQNEGIYCCKLQIGILAYNIFHLGK